MTVVAQVLGHEVRHLVDYEKRDLLGGRMAVGSTQGVWMHSGIAETEHGQEPFSVVEKRGVNGESDREGWGSSRPCVNSDWWMREQMILKKSSDVLGDMGPHLRIPHLYAVEHRANWQTTMWTEALSGRHASTWPAWRFLDAAQALGEWQHNAVQEPPHRNRWMTDNFFTKFAKAHAPNIKVLESEAAWQHPELRAYSPDLRERLVEMRRHTVAIAESMPLVQQTVVHNDAWVDNMYGQDNSDETTTVLLDWAYGGYGPLGQDAGMMAMHALCHLAVRDVDPRTFVDSVFDSYIRGMEAVGEVTPDLIRQARFGFVAGMTARLAQVVDDTLLMVAEPNRPEAQDDFNYWRSLGLTDKQYGFDRRAEVFDALAEYSKEAMELAQFLDLSHCNSALEIA